MKLLRLAKYLANAGLCSRRNAELLITGGKIKVNGQVVRELPTTIKPDIDIVNYEGKIIRLKEKIYIMLNKPAGYISSVSDSKGRPTVVELVDIDERIYPVGRLDLDTEGLLLLTNDGDFSNLMLHPRYEIAKTYEVLVKGLVTDNEIRRLSDGILLEDGLTAPAKINIIKRYKTETLLNIEIHEGRKRQVKRMFLALNHPVIKLTRVRFGSLNIKGLKVGEYRDLTEGEVKRLINLAQLKTE